MPLFVLFKAMLGMSDSDVVKLILKNVENSTEMFKLLLPSIEQCVELKVISQINALDFVGKRISLTRDSSKPPCMIAFDVIYNSVLTHIPVVNDSFYAKAFYLAFMVKRLLMAHIDPENHNDNRDFYGNKRLELAGTLIGFVFEDAFKRYNSFVMVSCRSKFIKFSIFFYYYFSLQQTSTYPK